MRVLTFGASLLLAIGLISPIAMGGSADAATTVAAKTKVTKVAVAAKKKAKKPKNVALNFHPAPGATFNDPYNRGPYHATAIRTKAIRSINSAPRGSLIRVAMFNFRSPSYTNALVRAHQRGVQIQFIMFAGNDTKAQGNPDPGILRREFRKGNAKLPAAKRSWFRECQGSCRGWGGIVHLKFFTFSQVGTSANSPKWVVMYGSNNATDVAVHQQWNDWYTFTRQQNIYDDFGKIFTQAARDKGMYSAYRKFSFPDAKPGPTTISFYPYTGAQAKKQGDPVLAELNQIRCTGSTVKGSGGHTRIRIAQDAISQARGLTIAKRLATMKRRGCDIKIVYTLMGGNVKQILSAAHIPMVHYAYYNVDQGEYTMYLHAKDMTVEGVYGGQTNAFVTFNGTANWTPLPLHSDEIVGEIHDRATTVAYTNWINWLLGHRPGWWPTSNSTSGTTGRMMVPDGATVHTSNHPYALIKGQD